MHTGVLPRPAWSLAPFVPVYGAAVLARRWLYDVGWLPTSAPPLPTICVGGLEVGGSGKTPVVEWVLRWLTEQGMTPGLLTRGYGRAALAPALALRQRGENASAAFWAAALGDEAAMLVAAGLDVPVAACARRAVGARALARAGSDCIVMDDGFAHRALQRHLDVVVLRAEAPLGSGWLLPTGTLREPPSGLKRAHVVWLHHKHPRTSAPQDDTWRKFCPDAIVVRSRAVYAWVDAQGGGAEVPESPVLAVSGIARPASFLRAIKGTGAVVCRHVVFADHHRYTSDDVQHLHNMMTQCGAVTLAVTAKDFVKLGRLWPSPGMLRVLQTRVKVFHGMTHLVTAVKNVMKQ